MKLHYMGKFNLDVNSLPHGEHQPGAVRFKEAKDSKTLARLANGIALGLVVLFAIPLFFILQDKKQPLLLIGCLASMLTLFPHELLHAICFQKDVYLYTNLKQGMLFVIGPETMSKARFVWMSLLPNLVFGFLPYALGFVFPQQSWLLAMGVLSISMGAGDYINVFNALRQMPKGARTYLYQFNSWWYMP